MAITEEGGGNGLVMPVAPMYGGGFGGGGGFMGGDWAWIILLLVLCGGWGNGFGGGFGGGNIGNDLYPWMNQSNQINGVFRDQMINDNITGIRADLGDISTQLCNGFNGTQMSILQSVNGLQSSLASCCCENRLATQDLKYTIATEESATRTANAQNIQTVLDKLCQLELDGYKREIDSLRGQLSDAKLQASQTAQNAFIAQGLNDEVDALYNRLSNCPVPTTPVYGRTPIFTCNNNNGCGCGCGG